jgi:hypothetical protein
MIKKLLNIILVMSLFSNCNSAQNNNPMKDDKKAFLEECSKFYWFGKELIDLELMKKVVVDGLPATDFKTCSKYAHRFVEALGDSVNIGDKIFSIINDKKTKTYQLQISEQKKTNKNYSGSGDRTITRSS